jgi:hypothetical protein
VRTFDGREFMGERFVVFSSLLHARSIEVILCGQDPSRVRQSASLRRLCPREVTF